MENTQPMPLDGIRVLEAGNYVQAPVATRLLADFGAEVIKIEEPGRGDGCRSIIHLRGVPNTIHKGGSWLIEHNLANKKSVAINLKTEEGKGVLYKLVEKSDVFVQNYRNSAARRMGIDYGTLSQHNTRLIYAHGSGYGPKGPDAERIGYDYLAQARSGLMTIIGEADSPPLEDLNSPFDVSSATFLAFGVVLALRARDLYGIGQELDVSLLSASFHHAGLSFYSNLLAGQDPERVDRRRARDPLWNHYRCADGKWLVIAMVLPDRYWAGFCDTIGAPQLKEIPDFADARARNKNRDKLIPILDNIFATKAREEWLKIMSRADLGYAPVNTMTEFCNDPQVLANDYLVDFEHRSFGKVRIPAPPVQLSRTPGKRRLPAPEVGEHTDEVLAGVCGFSREEISALRKRGVLA